MIRCSSPPGLIFPGGNLLWLRALFTLLWTKQQEEDVCMDVLPISFIFILYGHNCWFIWFMLSSIFECHHHHHHHYQLYDISTHFIKTRLISSLLIEDAKLSDFLNRFMEISLNNARIELFSHRRHLEQVGVIQRCQWSRDNLGWSFSCDIGHLGCGSGIGIGVATIDGYTVMVAVVVGYWY